MRLEVDILVCMSGLAEDIKREMTVGMTLDVDVQHMDEAVNFLLFCPFDIRVNYLLSLFHVV